MIPISCSLRRHHCSLSSLVSFVVLVLVLGCAGPPKHPTWKNATGGEQHERLMWQAMHNKDWTSFERRLAPAFVGVDSAGKAYDRAGWVERWKSAGVGEYSLGDLQVQPEGADMVVTYVATLGGDVHSTGSSAPAPQMRVVSVWQQVKSGLILTSCTMTPIKPQ
jgi:Domain of unknown function (DUF4440)